MTIYTLYIFDRHCQCVYYHNWKHRPVSTGTNKTEGTANVSRFSTSSLVSEKGESTGSKTATRVDTGGEATLESGMESTRMSLQEEAKLVYGVVFSLRNMVRKLGQSQDTFSSYSTNTYKLHYFETPTNLKFILLTDPQCDSMRSVLQQIYVSLYVEFVVKNPLMQFNDTRWTMDSPSPKPQDVIDLDPTPRSQAKSLPAAVTFEGSNGAIGNELFKSGVDQFIKSLTVFD